MIRDKKRKRRGAGLLALMLVLQLFYAAVPGQRAFAAEQKTEEAEAVTAEESGEELRRATGSEIRADQGAEKAAERGEATDPSADADEIRTAEETEEFSAAGKTSNPATASEAVRTLLPGGENKAAPAVEEESTATRGKALLFCIEHDEALKEDPVKDGEAMQAMLLRLQNFAEDDIHLIKIDTAAAKDTDLKQIIKDAIDTYLSDNDDDTETLIYYSGHGGYDTQGGASLTLSGYAEDFVHARELRAWLEPYAGEINVVLDCCYSGGMLMSTDLSDDDDADSEAFAEDFVKEFKKFSGRIASPSELSGASEARTLTALSEEADHRAAANEGTEDAANSSEDTDQRHTKGASKFRIITAASRFETASQSDGIGGELTCALGDALGYNRNRAGYHTCAADTDGDGALSMKELSAYIVKQPMSSQPVFYPEKDTTAVFTYDTAGELSPADFDAALSGDVTLDSKGRLVFTLKLTNLSDETRSFDVGVYDALLTSQYYPDQQHFTEEDEKWESLIYRSVEKDGSSEIRLEGQETRKLLLELDIPETEENPYYYIRINSYSEEQNPWEASEEGMDAAFELIKCTAHVDTSMHPEAVQFRTPWMSETPADAQAVYRGETVLSDYLPVVLQFDEEPVRGNKKGTAACRLTIEVLDADGQLVSVLAKDRRPNYDNVGLSGTTYRYSSYTCYWDYSYGAEAASGTPGEKVPYTEDEVNEVFYQLRATVTYDDAKLQPKTVTTWLELHPATDNAARVITEYTAFESCKLEAAGTAKTLKSFQKTLTEALETEKLNAEADRQMDIEILSWDCGPDGVISAADAATSALAVVPGRTYTTHMRVTINEKDHAFFVSDCAVYAAGHTVKDLQVSEDGQSLRFSVEHAIPKTESLDPSKVKLDSKEALKPGGKLKGAKLEDATLQDEDISYYIFYDGQVIELTEEGWEIPETCRSFELWIVVGKGEDASIYVAEYTLEEENPTPEPTPTPEVKPDGDGKPDGRTDEAGGKTDDAGGKTDGKSDGDSSGKTDGSANADGKSDSRTDDATDGKTDSKTDGSGNTASDPTSETESTSSGSSHREGTGYLITAPTARRDGQWQTEADGEWSYQLLGERLTGWQYLYYAGGPAWFLFDAEGRMQTGWQSVNGEWYYLDPGTGAMRTGWIEDQGRWYFLNPIGDARPWGAMLSGMRTPDGYQLQADGSWDGQPKEYMKGQRT